VIIEQTSVIIHVGRKKGKTGRKKNKVVLETPDKAGDGLHGECDIERPGTADHTEGLVVHLYELYESAQCPHL